MVIELKPKCATEGSAVDKFSEGRRQFWSISVAKQAMGVMRLLTAHLEAMSPCAVRIGDHVHAVGPGARGRGMSGAMLCCSVGVGYESIGIVILGDVGVLSELS